MAYSRQMTRLPNHGFNFNKPPTMPHPFELDIINLSDQERANLVHQNIIPVDVYARGLRETTFELSLKEMPLNLLYAFSSKARREIPPESAIANYQAQQVTIWRVDKIAKTHIRELLLFAYNTCKHTAQGGTASILTRYFTCSGYMLLFKAAESLEMPLAQRWLQRSLQEDLPTMACDDLAACELYASELGMPYITTQFHPYIMEYAKQGVALRDLVDIWDSDLPEEIKAEALKAYGLKEKGKVLSKGEKDMLEKLPEEARLRLKEIWK